jgi:multidrug resistance protein, MATE family
MAETLKNQYGSFLPRFYKLATVSVLSNMMVPLAGLFDTAFLGHLQELHHLAGVILASLLFDYLYRILKFLRNSTNTLTARAVGEKNEREILLAGLRSGLIAVAIAISILCLQYPIHQLGFAILAGSPEIEASGVEYFNARIWGAPAVLLNFVSIGWFLGREMNPIVLLISLVGNGSNVLLDYLMIFRWGWGSMGAGLATALSQYLALLVGLVAAIITIDWGELRLAVTEIWERQVLKEVLALKGNILVRFLALISAYAIFTNFSADMGTQLLTENGLLLQIALLSQFTVQGIGITTQTLIANFKGQGDTDKMMPLTIVAIVNSLPIALGLAIAPIVFPQTIFGLLTNHAEIDRDITNYTIWLLPLLSFTAIAFILEGYFIGLKEGAILRNASLIAFGLVFLPVAIVGWYLHNVNLLWMSLTLYMATLIVYLGWQMFQTQQELKIQQSAV